MRGPCLAAVVLKVAAVLSEVTDNNHLFQNQDPFSLTFTVIE